MKLFIYGTLKRGYWNCDHYMKNERYIKDVATAPGFSLFEHSHGYPLLVRNHDNGQSIEGELWEVCDQTLARLDDMEGAAGYQRQQITLSDGTAVDTYIWPSALSPEFKPCAIRWSKKKEEPGGKSRSTSS